MLLASKIQTIEVDLPSDIDLTTAADIDLFDRDICASLDGTDVDPFKKFIALQ
jgi:hypothetical protein